MKLSLVLVLLLAPVAALVPTSASAACDAVVTHTVGSSQGVYYVQVRSHSGVAYVWKDTNGISGLQRGASHPVTSSPDPCVDSPDVTPDQRVA